MGRLAYGRAYPMAIWKPLPTPIIGELTTAIFYDNKLHQAGKETGQTHPLERFNNPCAKGSPAWCAKPCPSPRSSPITSEPSGYSSTTTTDHYFLRTTGSWLMHRGLEHTPDKREPPFALDPSPGLRYIDNPARVRAVSSAG